MAEHMERKRIRSTKQQKQREAGDAGKAKHGSMKWHMNLDCLGASRCRAKFVGGAAVFLVDAFVDGMIFHQFCMVGFVYLRRVMIGVVFDVIVCQVNHAQVDKVPE